MPLRFGCEYCWETTCICGWEGYITVQLGRDSEKILRSMTQQERTELKKRLDAEAWKFYEEWKKRLKP